MNEQTCKNCAHYLQHYILDNKGFCRVFCGHCTLSSRKKIDPYRKACDHFAPGTEDSERFVKKEYLSKELLRYVLDMELLPEIEDYPVPLK